MYTAVIMILFLQGPVTFSLNPPQPVATMAECEEKLDLLEARIAHVGMQGGLNGFGPIVSKVSRCLDAEEALRHPGLDAETKASIGEPA